MITHRSKRDGHGLNFIAELAIQKADCKKLNRDGTNY
jgi:hypothetical protein